MTVHQYVSVVVGVQIGVFPNFGDACSILGNVEFGLSVAQMTLLLTDARNRFIADPDHTSRLEHMLAPETGRRLAALIDPKRAMPGIPSKAEAIHRDTVYLTVVDGDGNACSFINSNYMGFGTGIGASSDAG